MWVFFQNIFGRHTQAHLTSLEMLGKHPIFLIKFPGHLNDKAKNSRYISKIFVVGTQAHLTLSGILEFLVKFPGHLKYVYGAAKILGIFVQ